MTNADLTFSLCVLYDSDSLAALGAGAVEADRVQAGQGESCQAVKRAMCYFGEK